MDRFDGTLARQLDLIEQEPAPRRESRITPVPAPRPSFRLLKQDVYAELTRRRRRAQIAARHALDDSRES